LLDTQRLLNDRPAAATSRVTNLTVTNFSSKWRNNQVYAFGRILPGQLATQTDPLAASYISNDLKTKTDPKQTLRQNGKPWCV
jgi:hypothetical protein